MQGPIFISFCIFVCVCVQQLMKPTELTPRADTPLSNSRFYSRGESHIKLTLNVKAFEGMCVCSLEAP